MRKRTEMQKYKTLTKKQASKAAGLSRKGWSQQKIAKKLGVAKQRVATALIKKGVGKRVAGTFWQDVKAYRKLSGDSWVESREATYLMKKWKLKRAKRHGKKEWKDFKEFWDDQKRQYESQEEKQEALAKEMEETYFESI